jgi:hypothetical protein
MLDQNQKNVKDSFAFIFDARLIHFARHERHDARHDFGGK